MRTERILRIATMKTDRHAPLRPNAFCILTWCIEGLPWDEMLGILAKSGGGGTPTEVQNMATRTGGINPNAAHFRESIRAESLQGEIPHSELPNHFPDSIGKTKKQTRKRIP